MTGSGTAPTSWTAAQLAAARFDPLRWVVRDLLLPGLTLLAGSPKIGKSWLSLSLSLAVARGGDALGGLPVHDPGPVLHLALEDTPRRLQGRLHVLLGREPAPEGLTVWVSCPPLAEGGGKLIMEWLQATPGARLVVVDVLARVSSGSPRGSNPYHAEYRELAKIKQVADGYGVSVLLIHHDRKADAVDILKSGVSGTQGQSGAPDTVMVLQRPRMGRRGSLYVTGRDLPESLLSLEFDAGVWTLAGEDGRPAGQPDAPAPAAPAVTDKMIIVYTRRLILEYLEAHPGAGPKAVAEGTGLRPALVRQHLGRAVRAGQAVREGRGRYVPVTPVTPVTDPAQSTPERVTADPGGRGAVTPEQC